MTFNLRFRILATMLPLWILLCVIGSVGLLLLLRLAGRIEVILHENYDSVLYMERLHEALERIDSSFQFALAGRLPMAKQQYDDHWPTFNHYLQKEQGNVTLEGEQSLVDRLTEMSKRYRDAGDEFYRLTDVKDKTAHYFGDRPNGENLYQLFSSIKAVAVEILQINQDHMEKASSEAKRTASQSVFWFGGGLVLAAFLATLLGWHTIRTILEPVRALHHAASEIASGNLDQVLPVSSSDELGALSQSFNTMVRHLREFRQSQVSRLVRAQRTSQATIDSFPDPVLVLDAEGAIEMANPAARRLLGVFPARDGQARSVWHAPDMLDKPLNDALRGQADFLPDGFENILRVTTESRERVFLPRILRIRDPQGDLLGAAVLLQDVTGLRVLDEMKSNLVATVSHELKTPLTSIRLAVHLLLEEAVGPLTTKQTELLLDARENSERLLNMIENLLNLARFEQGRRQLEILPQPPRELLRLAADSVRVRAQEKGINLEVEAADDLPTIAVDSARMEAALGNLLDNALAYTDRGGSIRLQAETSPGGIVLTVSDTGQGIPADALPHVFEKFFRVPGRSRPGGTGLGLAIVHEIVTAHGGTVTCESKPNQGTSFRITLPT